MPIAGKPHHMRHRGLLTADDREYFHGEREEEEEEDRTPNDIRYRIRQRINNLQDDLLLLREEGEHDLLAQFHQQTDRTALLEHELDARRDENDE
jgi:hypothetical protein